MQRHYVLFIALIVIAVVLFFRAIVEVVLPQPKVAAPKTGDDCPHCRHDTAPPLFTSIFGPLSQPREEAKSKHRRNMNTVFYRIKSKPEKVAMALPLLAEDSNVSSLERILVVSELAASIHKIKPISHHASQQLQRLQRRLRLISVRRLARITIVHRIPFKLNHQVTLQFKSYIYRQTQFQQLDQTMGLWKDNLVL
jgi:hypothetical protein